MAREMVFILKHPRHDPAFYRLLDELFPDWRRIKVRLESSA
jgi:predicted metal-dependent hydrolase